MMKKKIERKRGLSILLVVLTTLTLTLGGCSSKKADDSSTDANGQTADASSEVNGEAGSEDGTVSAEDLSQITIGIPQDIDSMDPHLAKSAGTREILFNVYEGLVKPDADGNLQPAIASDYTISDDGKTYTFTLRDGVKFHDGSTVTVEDVKYSIERNAGTDGSDPLISAFSNIESVETPDESTIVLTLKEANTEFLAYMIVSIIPASNEDPEGNPIGTGPYKFVSRSPQENVILTKFDDYWGDAAYIKDITLKVVANSDSIVMELEGGSLDMYARVTSAQVSQLSDKFDVYEGTMNLVQALYLNNAKEPFNNVQVRQALCYAIDPQTIMDFVSDGKGTEIGSSMFPSFGKYFDESLNDTYNQDIAKAKELLAEAGYPNGFDFTITVPSNYTQHVDTAQVLVEQFKEIGVNATIQEVEWNTWLDDVYTNRNFQSTVVGVDASTLTAYALLSRYGSDAHNNFINFSDADYDAALAAAVKATDDAEKTAKYKECEKILSEKAANVYIQDLPEFVVLNKNYTGYTFYPLYAQDFAKIKPAQ
ncbi:MULTISPECIES: ABC transporter substrate-binding protein [unclassified Butyrivibrio]|uniref:ABC transporter substrate-binding protein n=1 Tax=unclassified Butyrivibrio TaxID=2639466 RepID=UPI00042360DE|nr:MULTISPECIES: ABC transporter substrate-binding protein [unclassified Butyrivibrio]